MTTKPSNKVVRLVALVACAGALFANGAAARPVNEQEVTQADSSSLAPSPEMATVEIPDGLSAERVKLDGVEWGVRAHVYPWAVPSGLSNDRLSLDGESSPSGPNLDGFMTSGLGTNARANAHTLTYYGGPVIQRVNVLKVSYGAGTYQSFVSGTGAGTMSAFFKGVLGSAYFTWLNNDYKTTTPAQTIGTGTFGGDYAITPSTANNGATINDTAIQAELVAQINAGHLPAPTANNLYFIYFPKGKKIQQGTSYSCQSGGFCAYHGTIKSASTPGGYIYYAVMPDNSTGSGCDSGCGTSTAFNNWCSVSSHELVEAVTDPAVGVATTYSSPLAWYNKTYGEIGDICNAQQGSVVGTDGVTYTVQKEWSTSTNTCRSQ